MSRVNKFPSNHSFNLWGVSHHNDHKFPSDLVKKSSRPHHPRPFFLSQFLGSFLVSENPEMGPTTGDKKSGKSVRRSQSTLDSDSSDHLKKSDQWSGGQSFFMASDNCWSNKNPVKEHQLRLLVYLIIYKILAPSQVVFSPDVWSIKVVSWFLGSHKALWHWPFGRRSNHWIFKLACY